MTTANEIRMMNLANARLQEIYDLKAEIAALRGVHETGTNDPIDFPQDKSDVELNLDKDQLDELMLAAHERDITLNQLVEDILREVVNKSAQERSY